MPTDTKQVRYIHAGDIVPRLEAMREAGVETIHCFTGQPPCFIGADWEVQAVIDWVQAAEEVVWINPACAPLDHCLGVRRADGSVWWYELSEVPDAELAALIGKAVTE